MSDVVAIIGRHPVREAIAREPLALEKVLLQQGLRSLGSLRRQAYEAGVPVQDVPLARLKKLAGGIPHQGVMAVRAALAYTQLEGMLQGIAPDLDAVRRTKPRLLVLDCIEDPRNYGALIRSAIAAGIQGLIVTSRRMAPLNATVVKASAGTALRIPVARTDQLSETLYQLKERGYHVAGTAMQGGVSVWSVDWDRPMAVVVGSEGAGLRSSVAQECDFMITIPMPGDVESLNVSVAAGIILFAATAPPGISSPSLS